MCSWRVNIIDGPVDWLALKLMFEPVNPVALPFGFTLHGKGVGNWEQGEEGDRKHPRWRAVSISWKPPSIGLSGRNDTS